MSVVTYVPWWTKNAKRQWCQTWLMYVWYMASYGSIRCNFIWSAVVLCSVTHCGWLQCHDLINTTRDVAGDNSMWHDQQCDVLCAHKYTRIDTLALTEWGNRGPFCDNMTIRLSTPNSSCHMVWSPLIDEHLPTPCTYGCGINQDVIAFWGCARAYVHRYSESVCGASY